MLKNLHRIQHGLDARDFVRAEQIGFAQCGQHGKERFGATDFVPEKFKRVGQGVADGKSQRPQPERIEENFHLMPHAYGAVLQVAVIETEARIEQDFLHAVALRDFNLARKVFAHLFNRIAAQIEIADFTDIFALDVTDDDRGVVRGDHAEKLIAAFRAGEVQDIRAGFQARARDGGLSRFQWKPGYGRRAIP